jgi:hypothetical protein
MEHRWAKDEPMVCGECGWTTTWGEYLKSYQRRQLHGGKAYPDFMAFLEVWPKARTYRDKLLAIDRLIHALHVDAKHGFARPAAVNLIELNLREARELLHLRATRAAGGAARVRLRRDADALAAGVHRVAGLVHQLLVLHALRVGRVETADQLWLHAPRPPEARRSSHLIHNRTPKLKCPGVQE